MNEKEQAREAIAQALWAKRNRRPDLAHVGPTEGHYEIADVAVAALFGSSEQP